jgi:hypothetical protein
MMPPTVQGTSDDAFFDRHRHFSVLSVSQRL